MKLEKILKRAAENKAVRKRECDGVAIRLEEDRLYPAAILDMCFEEENEKLILTFLLICGKSTTERKFCFSTRSNALFYLNEMCDTLGIEDDLTELIGKLCFLCFERSGQYLNVRVIEEATEDEFQDSLNYVRSEKKDKAGLNPALKAMLEKAESDEQSDEEYDDDEEFGDEDGELEDYEEEYEE